jgi:hypothetical protein
MVGARVNVSSTRAIPHPQILNSSQRTLPKSERPSMPVNTAIADLPLNTHSIYERSGAARVVWSRKAAPASLRS